MLKKAVSTLSAAVSMLLLTVCAFAETTVGASSGDTNVPTGVTIDWLPIAICGGVLVVAIIVFVVMTVMKKKKK